MLGTNRLLADKFAQTFSDPTGLNIPVIPTFGNNDILPHNILLPGPNKWLSYYADIWRAFIPEEQRHSFEFGGWFYVEVIPNKLAVFSLNTLYFFDRNAGVDDCEKPSEPGFKHMEWLRVQLQFMRDRSMKAILMGHVPPAHTESKMLWHETCWQKYTLWLQQYRDIVVAGLYGHMNIDHFLLSDTREITIDDADVQSSHAVPMERGDSIDFEPSVQSATDYLQELRAGWAKLPKVKLNNELQLDSAKNQNSAKIKDKLGGKWAERYQLSLVSPSIVPNYFPTLRIYEYNVTGLDDAVVWAEYKDALPTVQASYINRDQKLGTSEAELELRSLLDDSDGVHDGDESFEAEQKKDRKKGKKSKDGAKPKDPNLVIPSPPAKVIPPGPAYSPQPLTLLGYNQYFANLTYLNNDIIASSGNWVDDTEGQQWRDGKHGRKKPKGLKPKPLGFSFEIEYTTFNDSIYNMTDLTVRSFVELAYRMGRSSKANSAQSMFPGGGLAENSDKSDDELLEIQTDENLDEFGGEDLDAFTNRKDDNKMKNKKKAKDFNKTWLHFLRHAFVSTVEDEELKEKFS